ncbi:MAG: hypothetical protein M0Q49_01855 [Porticoccaceae bacterium]|nr:hypothetical protein [Porticoccaceae bacterium]
MALPRRLLDTGGTVVTLPRHITGYRSRILNAIVERLRIQRPVAGPGILIRESTGGTVISALLRSPDSPFVPVSMRCLGCDAEDYDQPRTRPPDIEYDVYVLGMLPPKNEKDPEKLKENRLLKKIDPGQQPHLFRRDSYWMPWSHGHKGDTILPAGGSRNIAVGGDPHTITLSLEHSHVVEDEYWSATTKNPTRLWTEPATFGIAMPVATPSNEESKAYVIVWCNEFIKEIDDEDYDPDDREEDEDDDCDQNDHPAIGGPGAEEEEEEEDRYLPDEDQPHPGLDDDDAWAPFDDDEHPGEKDCYTSQ